MVDRQVERRRPLRSPSGLPSEPPPPNDPLGLSTAPPESVTHVSGLECYPCLRPFSPITAELILGHRGIAVEEVIAQSSPEVRSHS